MEMDKTGVWCYPCNTEVTPTITTQYYLDEDSNMQMTMTIDWQLRMDNTIRFNKPKITDDDTEQTLVRVVHASIYILSPLIFSQFYMHTFYTYIHPPLLPFFRLLTRAKKLR